MFTSPHLLHQKYRKKQQYSEIFLEFKYMLKYNLNVIKTVFSASLLQCHMILQKSL